MRLGMLIDLDHSSLHTVHAILKETGDYPLVSGHNGLRKDAAGNENGRTVAQYVELARRGGMAGVGWGAAGAAEFLRTLKNVHLTGVPIALGSDINGLVKQLPPPPRRYVTYSDKFPKPLAVGLQPRRHHSRRPIP